MPCPVEPKPPDRKSTRLNSSHTVIYTLSLHDALPTCSACSRQSARSWHLTRCIGCSSAAGRDAMPGGAEAARSEEHTSELQSHSDLHSFPTRRSSDLLGLLAPVRPLLAFDALHRLFVSCWPRCHARWSRSR